MLNTKQFKKYAKTCGADVVRVGSMSGWEGAPKQNDARYIFPDAKCIIGLAFRIPRGYLRGIEEGTFFSVYEFMGYSGLNLTYMPVALREIVCYIEDHGYEAVPIPNWDSLTATYHTDYLPEDDPRATGTKNFFHSRPVSPDKPRPDVFISYRAAAVISNLGEIGWSKMVLTPEFGPRQRVVFILTDAPLDLDDPILPGTLCDRCMLCAKNCTGQAIPLKESTKERIAGIEIEHCKLDLARCSNAYSGGNRKFNPFWNPDVKLKEKDFMNEYLSKKYFNRDPKGPCPRLISRCRNNPAIEGARGCMRACMIHLEEQGKLKNKFVHPFRRHKEWMLD
jgi:epoxyqueuosine reductase